jgi:hypothetical protein
VVPKPPLPPSPAGQRRAGLSLQVCCRGGVVGARRASQRGVLGAQGVGRTCSIPPRASQAWGAQGTTRGPPPPSHTHTHTHSGPADVAAATGAAVGWRQQRFAALSCSHRRCCVAARAHARHTTDPGRPCPAALLSGSAARPPRC